MDILSDLDERFVFGAFHYRDMWHMRGNGIPPSEQEQNAVALFDTLSDSINDVAPKTLQVTEELRREVGSEAYEAALFQSIGRIGYASFPQSAEEFLSLMNLTLQCQSKLRGHAREG